MSKAGDNNDGPSSFFKETAAAFAQTIRARRDRAELVGAICARAFDSFEHNVAIQAEGAPALACAGECAACCALRVVATAPEILLVARFVEVNAPAFLERGIDLRGRVAEMETTVGGLPESERLALRRDCPLLEHGLCLAYRLRPLACRGHAAYDRDACAKVTAGENIQVDISTPHLVVRGLIQNAMMSALRDARLAWRLYEINRGLHIALTTPNPIERWIAGEDPLAAAAIAEFDARETASVFDEIAGR
ncbi:MAG: YkgJ family cysteine cluster protein [Methylocystis sp.]